MGQSDSQSTRRGNIIVLSGPSGIGKSTIINGTSSGELLVVPGLRQHFSNIGFSVSATTRKLRPGEVDGREYFFMDDTKFDALKAQGAFLEHAGVHGKQYGTLASKVLDAVNAGKDIILDIDVQGMKQLSEYTFEGERPHIVSFFFHTKPEILRRRLVRRGMNQPDILIRVGNASGEMEFVQSHPGLYDHVIENMEGQLQHTIAQVVSILRRVRGDDKPASS